MIELVKQTLSRHFAFIHSHQELMLILFISFMTSLFLSNWNSYWYDELLSVTVYGIYNSNVFEVIGSIGNDPHPPLYQAVLFLWMKVFGHSEIATRALSALFVGLTNLCLYIMAVNYLVRRIAVAASIFFCVLYMVVYYSLETRSYAQLMFLSALSTLILFEFLKSLPTEWSWYRGLLNYYSITLIIVNMALLFTHFFGAFFLAAQGTFLVVYIFCTTDSRNVLSKVIAIGIQQALPLVLLLVVWGVPVGDAGGGGLVEGKPTDDFITIVNEVILEPNIDTSVGLVAVLLLLMSLISHLQHNQSNVKGATSRDMGASFHAYILAWLFLPICVALLLFMLGDFQPARINPRYFIFSTPPVALMLAIALEQLAKTIGRIMQHISNSMWFWCFYTKSATFLAIVIASVVAAPGGLAAASHQKHDWRGIAQRLVEIIDHDDAHHYIIYQVSLNSTPLLNYYLQQYSQDLRVGGSIVRSEEAAIDSGDDVTPSILHQEMFISEYDYLVLVFAHERATNYPNILGLLENRYTVHHAQLNRHGRGFIVYQVGETEFTPAVFTNDLVGYWDFEVENILENRCENCTSRLIAEPEPTICASNYNSSALKTSDGVHISTDAINTELASFTIAVSTTFDTNIPNRGARVYLITYSGDRQFMLYYLPDSQRMELAVSEKGTVWDFRLHLPVDRHVFEISDSLFIAISYDDENRIMRLIVDDDYTIRHGITMNRTRSQITFGAWGVGFEGCIDRLGIWSRPMSVFELLSLNSFFIEGTPHVNR